ncbi:BTB/POZ domain-containing protein At1g03010-like isoform X1 [Zingiber officinale]|uniref:BTB/POZ domain-containing protein At1g03010-like isoform X1 n=1 Tax=Zingiber officinale TaxID=94328 RepID=UPI001C4CE50B|nr:BTB/POZ domain-containing protein At1g03010-like isoform X1 [Zingiber officinale]XP_042428629.1 BTB/POZ domain-containing protein At1g03010-like isoform X1 [Zingiber officinale]
MNLERRIGLRLDRAIIADILIPANCRHKGAHSIYDTDSALRIFSIFLNSNDEEEEEEHRSREDIDGGYYEQSSLLKVSNLLDSYLAEIALDSNSTPAKFIALAELLPDHTANDGLYRAIDIFLKIIYFRLKEFTLSLPENVRLVLSVVLVLLMKLVRVFVIRYTKNIVKFAEVFIHIDPS